MSKIKRNNPCPCGSGKKYKKCCGASNVSNSNPQLVNNELGRLHQELISFALNNYNNEINQQIEQYDKPLLSKDEELIDIYTTGLTIWIILIVPCLKNNQTIFDAFYHANKSKITQETRNIFADWAYRLPSIYEVLTFDRTNFYITVKDILTHKIASFPVNKDNNFVKESLVIGTLVPYADYYNFVFTIIKLYRRDKDTLIQLLRDYQNKDEGLIKHFPHFLAEVVGLGIAESEWDNPLYEKVAQLFAEHMKDKDHDDEVISNGITLWKQYCTNVNPSFKKSETYAAALDLLVQQKILNNSSITQGQLAKEYGVSPSTISSNFRKLVDSLPGDI